MAGSDSFDRANNTSLGSPWVEDAGDWWVASNTAICNTSGNAYRKLRHDSAFNGNHYSECDLYPQSANCVGPGVRLVESSTVTYYGYVFFAGDRSYVVEITAGGEGVLSSGNTATTQLYTNCRLEADGSSLTATRNGSADISTSDSTLTNGVAGIIGYGGSTTAYADNWDGDDLGAAEQNLTATRYQDGDTFGSHTVTPQAVTLTTTRYQDGDAFGAATVSPQAATLTTTLYADGDAFGSHTVTPQAVTLTTTLYSDGDTYGNAVVTPDAISLTATLLSDGDTYGAPVITTSNDLAATLYADGDTFGQGQLNLNLEAQNYVSSDIFYNHAVSQDGEAQSLTATPFASTNSFENVSIDRLDEYIPTSDISVTGWIDNDGQTSDLYQALGYNVDGDATYILAPAGQSATFGVPAADPVNSVGHWVKYRYRKDGAGGTDLTVTLLEGVTTIASWTHLDISDTWVEQEQLLSTAQANSITDYGQLRIELQVA